jgi:hypothetical protein
MPLYGLCKTSTVVFAPVPPVTVIPKYPKFVDVVDTLLLVSSHQTFVLAAM